MKSRIQSIEVSLFIHATEDEDRIISFVESKLMLDVKPMREELEGHFGNRIVHVSYHVTGDKADKLLNRIVEMMPKETLASLVRHIGMSIDEHKALYLRFDKQEFMKGRIRIGASDPIRVKIKPRIYLMRKDAINFYIEVMGLSR